MTTPIRTDWGATPIRPRTTEPPVPPMDLTFEGCPDCLAVGREYHPDGRLILSPCDEHYPLGVPCRRCGQPTGLQTPGAVHYSCPVDQP